MTSLLSRAAFNLLKIKPITFNNFKYSSTLKETLDKEDSREFADIENPFSKPKKQCILCKYDIEPDYKNVRLLSQFQSRFTGRMYPRNVTGLCKNKHRKVYHEVCKARNAGMMGVVVKNPKYFNDPQLFDPNKPLIPHDYD